jgi:hypothetical protein
MNISCLARLRKYCRGFLAAAVMVSVLGLPMVALAVEEQAKFEQDLKESFPGSYSLYEHLDVDGKSKVFKEYKKTDGDAGIGRFSTVIAKILELSIQQ